MKVKAKKKGDKLVIKIKEKNKGKLHEELDVPQNKNIPSEKLEEAKENAGPAEKKRIVFAQNAKKWKK